MSKDTFDYKEHSAPRVIRPPMVMQEDEDSEIPFATVTIIATVAVLVVATLATVVALFYFR